MYPPPPSKRGVRYWVRVTTALAPHCGTLPRVVLEYEIKNVLHLHNSLLDTVTGGLLVIHQSRTMDRFSHVVKVTLLRNVNIAVKERV